MKAPTKETIKVKLINVLIVLKMNLEFLDAENEEVIVTTFNQKEKDRLLKKSGPFGAPGNRPSTHHQ